jgi:hypothetical protein
VIEATHRVASGFFEDVSHPLGSFERRRFAVLAANGDFTMYARC